MYFEGACLKLVECTSNRVTGENMMSNLSMLLMHMGVHMKGM